VHCALASQLLSAALAQLTTSVHVVPVEPCHPELHEHENDPNVSVHDACESQSSSPREHSSMLAHASEPPTVVNPRPHGDMK
jgi:hypothetical protein